LVRASLDNIGTVYNIHPAASLQIIDSILFATGNKVQQQVGKNKEMR